MKSWRLKNRRRLIRKRREVRAKYARESANGTIHLRIAVFNEKHEVNCCYRSIFYTGYCGRETTAEVLDLSHDYTTPFRLQFDDPSWQQFMGSLKPLGLAVLLNTCNPATQERYAQFCAQLSCLSKFHEDFVPVTNRRY